jgi:hypothetical protein
VFAREADRAAWEYFLKSRFVGGSDDGLAGLMERYEKIAEPLSRFFIEAVKRFIEHEYVWVQG